MSKIGQKTGTSKKEKKVITIEIRVPFAQLNQNLNSGILLVKGLYSFASSFVVGSDGPELGSSSGERNAMKLFNRYIPKP